MKQIDLKTKQKIMALYWGQEIMVWFYTGGEKAKNLCKVAPNHMAPYYIDRGVLEVKPLSSITDEDAIEVAKIYSDNPEYHKADRAKQKLFTFYENHWNVLPVDTADLLRSKGYALPAYGFSVDELVEAGVFKLKEVNND